MKSLFVEQLIKFKELGFRSPALSLLRKVFTANCLLFRQLAPANDSVARPWPSKVFAENFISGDEMEKVI